MAKAVHAASRPLVCSFVAKAGTLVIMEDSNVAVDSFSCNKAVEGAEQNCWRANCKFVDRRKLGLMC